jgi:hypothetical protein
VHRYSSLLQWSVPLGKRGHVAIVGRASKSHHCHVNSLYFGNDCSETAIVPQPTDITRTQYTKLLFVQRLLRMSK